MGEPLTTEAFTLWQGEHDKRIDTILKYQEQQVAVNTSVDRRLMMIETSQEARASRAATRTTYLSALVSAVVGGLTGWLAK